MSRLAEYLGTTYGADRLNPDFDRSRAEAHHLLRQLADDPRPLTRPLVLIGGYIDAARILDYYKSQLCPTIRDTPVIAISLGTCSSFAEARQRVIDCVREHLPGAEQQRTELDVIGLSLGGAVAVDAAFPSNESTAVLNVARLFALATPFTGVRIAEEIPFTTYLRDMRPFSPFMRRVAEQSTRMKVMAYAHLRDDIVGFEHCAPPGKTARWLSDHSWFWPHLAALFDVRIVADIAVRLRTGNTVLPPSPPRGEG